MTHFIHAALAGAALVACASPAFAETTFTTNFTYSPTAPADETLAQFEETARRACRAGGHAYTSLAMKSAMESTCRKKLISDAVHATRMDRLIALHDSPTYKPARQFAGRQRRTRG